MDKLPKINDQQFNLWLRFFLQKNIDLDGVIIFIDLFQNNEKYSSAFLSQRIKEYIGNSLRKKKKISLLLDPLVDFLVEMGAFKPCVAPIITKKIRRILV